MVAGWITRGCIVNPHRLNAAHRISAGQPWNKDLKDDSVINPIKFVEKRDPVTKINTGFSQICNFKSNCLTQYF